MNAPFHVTRVEAALGRATARIAELEEEIARLRLLMRLDHPETPVEWGLTAKENELLLAIASVAPSPLSTLRALSLAWPEGPPTPRAVSVHIARIRAKLKPFGILVRSVGRRGYHLDAGSLEILRAHRSRGVDTNRRT